MMTFSFFSRLLDVLSARKDPTGLQGAVLIDGQSQPADFKLISGYVVQVSSIVVKIGKFRY